MWIKILQAIGITAGIFLISLTGVILRELFFGDYLDKVYREEFEKWWTGERKDYPIR
jgi:hypothetical protein